MDTAIILNLVVNGVARAMTLFIISSGLTLVFGVLKVINFAHGAFFMLGAYMAITFQLLIGHDVFWPSLLFAALSMVCVAALIERIFLRKLYQADHVLQILFTYSLVLVADGCVKIFWGLDPMSIAKPDYLSGSLSLVGSVFPIYSIFLITVGVLSAVLLWLLLKSKVGAVIRAAAADPDITGTLGKNVSLIYTSVFVLGVALAAFGGVLVGPTRVISPVMGVVVLIECFAVVIVGGMGSLKGTLIASLIIGLLNTFISFYYPQLSLFIVYICMAFILIVKPRGLFGV
jgi:branched-subunit amino acid ABC-type transport system permease component